MRKTLILESPVDSSNDLGNWLDLENVASVEVTSESPAHPIESVFAREACAGWRANEAGKQLVRLIFDQPQSLRRIQLRFSETSVERTQEFTLHWAPVGGQLREIVRQQWNFSPDGPTAEVEDYHVDLDGVSQLQLTLNPDITYGRATASLSQWRIA